MFKDMILYIKENKITQFFKDADMYGFNIKEGGSYVCRNYVDEKDDLYIEITVSISDRRIYVEINVPKPYWIEFGMAYLEPLFTLYKNGFIEMKNLG